jgi:isoleucyl-tRNA synthetase
MIYFTYVLCFYITDFFSSMSQILQRFATVGLSNFYLDVAKDRLYVGYCLFSHMEYS